MKAFDKLEWKAIYIALQKFNVGETFINYIKILHKNPTSTILNNGYWSDWFYPTRGTRQGDPLSPTLFILTLEILGIKIRQSERIKGAYIDSSEFVNAQYADDMYLVLEPTEENINEALKELQKFQKFSGLQINFSKTVAFILGPLRNTDAKFYTMKQLFWSDGPVKILGCYIHPDKEVIYKKNFEDVLEKIKAILQNWSHRSLSVLGKIVILNTLISSLLVHKFMALPSPEPIFYRKYKAIILEFLWDKKVPKVRYKKLVQSWPNMGLQLIDIEAKNTSLKVAWLARWSKKGAIQQPWIYWNLPIKDPRIWECNANLRDISYYCNQPLDMSVQILKAKAKLHFTTIFEENIYMNTPIWFNSMIRRADQPFLDSLLINSNINTLSDIWDLQAKNFVHFDILIEQHGNVIPLLTYRSLVASIPTLWKEALKQLNTRTELDLPGVLDSMTNVKNISRKLYWAYIERFEINYDSCCELWSQELKTDFHELQDKWPVLHDQIRSISVATKLRWLQYRLLNRYLTTNVRRSKWDKTITHLCTFCQEFPETIVHLMWECKEVKLLWKALTKWMGYYYKIKIACDLPLIILNNYTGPSKKFANMVILVMKQYIYSSKCKQESPHFVGFINCLDYWYQLEKYEMFEKDSFNQFMKKWKKYELAR